MLMPPLSYVIDLPTRTTCRSVGAPRGCQLASMSRGGAAEPPPTASTPPKPCSVSQSTSRSTTVTPSGVRTDRACSASQAGVFTDDRVLARSRAHALARPAASPRCTPAAIGADDLHVELERRRPADPVAVGAEDQPLGHGGARVGRQAGDDERQRPQVGRGPGQLGSGRPELVCRPRPDADEEDERRGSGGEGHPLERPGTAQSRSIAAGQMGRERSRGIGRQRQRVDVDVDAHGEVLGRDGERQRRRRRDGSTLPTAVVSTRSILAQSPQGNAAAPAPVERGRGRWRVGRLVDHGLQGAAQG